jgi:hypothetical protein
MIILIVVFLSDYTDYTDCKSIYSQVGCRDGSWPTNPVFILINA